MSENSTTIFNLSVKVTELHIGYFGSGSILNEILNIQALGKY